MEQRLTALRFADSFELSLKAKRRSPNTIYSYLLTLRQFVEFCEDEGLPSEPAEIRRVHVEKFIGHTLATRSVNTAGLRYRNLVQFFRWLVDEDEIESHPMTRMTPPVAPEVPIPILSDEALTGLLSVTEGKGFYERRDHAILRLFIATGCRISEITNLAMGDVDLIGHEITVTVKGGDKGTNPFGPKAAVALDRYLRMRPAHPHAGSPMLWLGPKGPLTRSGVQQMIAKRGVQAGLGKIHAHQFRHTSAHEFLDRGGSESDLMRLKHWKSERMAKRYGAALADERAKKRYREMNPGDRV